MTYGRPSMTSHLPSVPLPETGEEEHSSGSPSPMAFYISTIVLYRILDSILSDIYGAWRGRSSPGSRRHATKHCRLDVIIEIEERLSEYENNLPHFLNWNRPLDQATNPEQSTLHRQRNVLHARYLYLHLLLYRPIFTQLCSESVHPRIQADKRSSSHPSSSSLYASILSKCAAACVRAAIDLVFFVHETYQTSATDPWWYNGFCTAHYSPSPPRFISNKSNRYFHSRHGPHHVLHLRPDPSRARAQSKSRARSLVKMRTDSHIHESL